MDSFLFDCAKSSGFGSAVRENLEVYVKYHRGLEKAWDYLYEERGGEGKRTETVKTILRKCHEWNDHEANLTGATSS